MYQTLQKRIKIDSEYLPSKNTSIQSLPIHQIYDINAQLQRKSKNQNDNDSYSTLPNNNGISNRFPKYQQTLSEIDLQQVLQYCQNKLWLETIVEERKEQLLPLLAQISNKQLLVAFFKRCSQNSQDFLAFVIDKCQNLDKEIRSAALLCLSRLTIKDDNLLLSTILKPLDTAELILTKGRKGLLISILEDQYEEVRINGIRVISNFITQSQSFATQVLDILIYMLNDEMDNVRIEAIKVLKSQYSVVEFSRNEINSIKFNLYEHNFKLRIAIYELCGIAVFQDRYLLLDILNLICANVIKFPQDFDCIAKSLKIMGEKNNQLLMINEILQTKERLSQEPDWLNKEYIIRMVYIYHATQRSKTDPFYFQKHFEYFLDEYPEFFQNTAIKPCDLLALKLLNLYKSLIREIHTQYNKCSSYQLHSAQNILQQIHSQFDTDTTILNDQPIKQLLEFNYKIDKINQSLEIRNNLKTQLNYHPIFKYRQFKFLLPVMNSSFKVQPEFQLQIRIVAEFKLLKEPITKNYGILIIYMDRNQELHKIGKQDIEDNLLTTTIELQRKIKDFSQTIDIQFIEINSKFQVGENLSIFLQV